jgi:hypothetical protein
MATLNKDNAEALLVEMNVRWLNQALQLVESLDDYLFTTSPNRLSPHRAGGHLRHILEFYECFLEGLESGQIDYDVRRREDALERSREAAADRLRTIILRLRNVSVLRNGDAIWVRMEDAAASGVDNGFLSSSIGRELQVLSSHTIHHFALIAVTLKMLGFDLHSDFGMAPSTLRFQAAICAR